MTFQLLTQHIPWFVEFRHIHKFRKRAKSLAPRAYASRIVRMNSKIRTKTSITADGKKCAAALILKMSFIHANRHGYGLACIISIYWCICYRKVHMRKKSIVRADVTFTTCLELIWCRRLCEVCACVRERVWIASGCICATLIRLNPSEVSMT